MWDYRVVGLLFYFVLVFGWLVSLFSCSVNVSFLFSLPLVVLRTKVIFPLTVLFA